MAGPWPGYGKWYGHGLAWPWIDHGQTVLGQRVDLDKKYEKINAPKMKFSILESPSGPCGIIFGLFGCPQLDSK